MYEIIRNSQQVIKTFVFQKQDTHQSVMFDQEIDFKQTYVNLNHLLTTHSPLSKNKVSIYDPMTNRFVTLRSIGGQHGYIARNYLEPSYILFRYHQKQQNQDEEINGQSSYSLTDKDKKDPRSRERTVAQVIQLVKKWRQLHIHCFKTPESTKKMNLQQAAIVVGVAKKSLDDYYCQLRLAQLYKFDFKNNLQQKMGVLRGFVKDQRSLKDENFSKHYRHPKNLKIIDKFQLQSKSLSKQQQMEEKQLIKINLAIDKENQPRNDDNEQNEQDNEEQSKPPCRQLCTLQKQFYGGFEFLLDDPCDPFLQMASKKSIIEESQGILFF